MTLPLLLTRTKDNCEHCHNCERRRDWDFIRDFFHREQTLLHEQQNSQAQLAALQLTQYSTRAHLLTTEQQRDNLELQGYEYQNQINELNMQYNHLWGRYARAAADLSIIHECYDDLVQTNQANEAALAQQTHHFQQQTIELNAAHATAKELGDMVGAVVSADDFASEAFDGAIKVADIMLRNKFQELQLERLQRQLEECRCNEERDDTPELASSPTLGKYSCLLQGRI